MIPTLKAGLRLSLGLLLLARISHSQTPPLTSGCIEDPSGSIVAGARVLLLSADGKRLAGTQSDERGCFVLPQLSGTGTVLKVIAEGFAEYRAGLGAIGPYLGKVVLAIPVVASEVIVTATRTPSPAESVGASVDIVDSREIEVSQSRTAADLLRGVAGVAVTQTGATGGITTLFTRGGESDYTKILLDGIPVNQPGGTYDFSHIATANLSRVEVVRGPQSALFGSDAMAGVVQLFSKTGTRKPQFDYSWEGGSFATTNQQVSVRGGVRRFDFSNSFSRYDTDNDFRNNDYRNASNLTSLGWSPNEQHSLRVTFLHSNVKAGAPGVTAAGFTSFGPDDRLSRLERAGGATYRTAWRSRLNHRIGYRWYDYDYRFRNSFGGSVTESTRKRGEYQGELVLPEWPAFRASVLTFGVDIDRQSGLVGGSIRRRNNNGYYLQQQAFLFARLDLTAGARFEDNEAFGQSFSPRIAVAYRLARSRAGSTRLRLAAGAGVKEPSLIENFSTNRFFQGSPNLLPERSRSWEGGIEQGFWRDRASIDVTWFANRFRNLIELISQPNFSGRYANIGRTASRGLEMRTRVRSTRWTVSANYTYLSGSIRESKQLAFPFRVGDPLLRRPRHAGDIGLTWFGERWTASWATSWIGRRADSDFFTFTRPLTSNPGYSMSRATFAYTMNRVLTLHVRAANVFGRDYQEVLGFQALGRSVVAGLRIHVGAER